jgi:hypothetical protein
MNMTAISLVFDDPGRAVHKQSKEKWEPNQRYKDLQEEYQKMVDTTPSYGSKPNRNEKYNDNSYSNKTYKLNYTSYANAARNHTTNQYS